jgi:cytochrome d ubiquinol oxidase subunit II
MTGTPSFLQVLWLILVAVLWIGFFILEGFDFGVAMLVPFLGKGDKGKDDQARRVVINTIGPHWDGNEVWLLTAGGATFAAFPAWYATLFSGLYLPLFLVLVGLIIRGVAFEYRSKREAPQWRYTWDWVMAIGSFIPALVLGVGFAWFLIGIPTAQLPTGYGAGALTYGTAPLIPGAIVGGGEVPFFGEPSDGVVDAVALLGNFSTSGGDWGFLFGHVLLNPFALIGGLLFVGLFLAHGAYFVALKTRGAVHDRAQGAGNILGLVAAVLMLVFVVLGNLRIGGTFYSAGAEGLWSIISWVVGIVAVLGLCFAWFMNSKKRDGWAFIGTTIATAMLIVMVFVNMGKTLGFAHLKTNVPAVVPGYPLGEGLTWTTAAASGTTLTLMTIVAAIMVPVVLAYTAWSYFFVFRRRLNTVSIPALTVNTKN